MKIHTIRLLSLSLLAASAGSSLLGMDADAKQAKATRKALSQGIANVAILNGLQSDGPITRTIESIADDRYTALLTKIETLEKVQYKQTDDLKQELDQEQKKSRQFWNILISQGINCGATILVDKYLNPDKILHRASGRDLHIATMNKLRTELEEHVDDMLTNPASCTPDQIQVLKNRSKQIAKFDESNIADYQTTGKFDAAGNYEATGETAPTWLPYFRSKTAETIERHVATAAVKVVGIWGLDQVAPYASNAWKKTFKCFSPKKSTRSKPVQWVKTKVESLGSYSHEILNDSATMTSAIVGDPVLWSAHRAAHQTEKSTIDKKIATLERCVNRNRAAQKLDAIIAAA
jgi:hypothetical protein